MALLPFSRAEEIAVSSGGGRVTSRFGVTPWFGVTPVLKYPAPTNGNGSDGGCTDCSSKPTIPTGGITPIIPPPEIVRFAPGAAIPTNPNPTYSDVANSLGVNGATTKDGVTVQSDWWKYLVGAAVGYFLAKR